MTDSNSAAASSDHDSPWKEALERYFPDFLALLFPHIHAEIDWTRGHSFLDKELQRIVRDAETGRRYVDKLVAVARRDGSPACVLVHVEVQGEPEAAQRPAHVRLQPSAARCPRRTGGEPRGPRRYQPAVPPQALPEEPLGLLHRLSLSSRQAAGLGPARALGGVGAERQPLRAGGHGPDSRQGPGRCRPAPGLEAAVDPADV